MKVPVSGICLNMIVRNEADIITRCLKSVAPHVNYWVILDTGSNDETPALIEEFFARTGIQGELHHGGFIDFSSARNQALDLCRQSTASFEYILFIDADMQLVVENTESLQALEESVYSMQQRSELVYDNVRLVHRSSAGRYVGVTHEYLDSCDSPEQLKGVYMLDHACGSSRKDKSARDIRLLTQGLSQDPHNGRYMFYLAQSLREAGRFEDAIEWYRKRVVAGGWEEECWYSSYQIAHCLWQTGETSAFIIEAMASWNQRPWRAEPLALLARYYRQNEQHELACEFAAMGLRIPFPEQDKLFIDLEVYQWAFSQEMAIAGYYAHDRAHYLLGRSCCHRLAQDARCPAEMRDLARSNLVFYAHDASDWLGLDDLQSLLIPAHSEWSCLNPSVWIQSNFRAVIVRHSNYRLEDGQYNIGDVNDLENIVRTENSLVSLDDKNVPGRVRLLHLATPPEGPDLARRFNFPVKGYEDCRLVRWKDDWWAPCTVRDTTADGRCEIALLRFSASGEIKTEIILRGWWSNRHQKNWMPFIRGDELMFVYSLAPTIILRFDSASNTVSTYSESDPNLALEHLRGGSQLVETEKGWLGVCHEVCLHSNDQRYYLHRFFLLDKNYHLKSISEVFRFTGASVEFCAGLALESDGKSLVVSFGVNDDRAMLGVLDMDRVFSVLH